MKRLAILSLCLLSVIMTWADDSIVDGRQYDRLFLEAMVQRQKGNSDAAFNLLSRCVELNPQAPEAYFFLAGYYRALRQDDKALEYYRTAARLRPSNTSYLEMLADELLRQRLYDEGIQAIEQLYAQAPRRQELLDVLLGLYVSLDDYPNVINVLNRKEQLDGKTEAIAQQKSRYYLAMDSTESAKKEILMLTRQYPNDLNYQRLYADFLLLNSEADEAFTIYSRILSEEPDNALTQLSLHNYFLQQQDSTAADSVMHCLLLNSEAGTEEKVYLLRGVIQRNEAEGGDSTKVLALFQQLLAMPQPNSDLAQLCAAYMELKEMNPRDIVPVYRQVLDIAPDNAAARIKLVAYAWEQDDNKGVVDLCQEARQYNPEEMAFYYYQGMAYYRLEDIDNALEAFQNGIGVINENSNTEIVSDFYAVMGDLLHQKGLEKQAFEAYDSCLQWKPDNVGCLNNYAYFLALKGEQLERAEKMSYRAIKAEPDNATYLDTYAWVLFVEGRLAEARIYIDQTIKSAQDGLEAESLEHAGDIYFLTGDTAEALNFWAQALEKDPQNKLLQKKVKRKKYLKK